MLKGLRVLDRTTEIAGPYCTKILADAGAEVLRAEPARGDPLRHYRSGGLFEYLNAAKRDVGADEDAASSVDVVVTDSAHDARELKERHHHLVVVCISPFGMDGPWTGRAATEFTLQATCGSTGGRGDPTSPPLAAGGRLGEWITGTYAALATLAAVGVDATTERHPGRLVDVAMLDCMAVTLVTYPSVFASFAGWKPMEGTGRVVEVPSIEATSDGYVVFTTNSAQQFEDFLVLIDRPDWLADKELALATKRFARRHEFSEAVRSYTKPRSTADVLEAAGALRIPAAPVLNGSTIAEFEQFKARGVFNESATGRFRQPRPPFRIGEGARQDDPAPTAPSSGQGRDAWPDRSDGDSPAGNPSLPLRAIRVLDVTAWWAGPSATHALACLGADVIKIESQEHPDPMRTASTRRPSDPQWMEWSPIFHAVNASKRAITLDLGDPTGKQLFERLARQADVVVENFTPRVMEQFGLDWARLHRINPRLVMVRMPAFGLDGPWRERTGFAQTMESISGLAWVTGLADGPPVLVRGACDPVAGMHGAIATLLALRARGADGLGRLVEVPMVEAALNVTAEQVIEWDLSGVVLGRDGSPGLGAPEGVYRCQGDDRWVAISVVTDEQWCSLRTTVGLPHEGRWAKHDGRLHHAEEIDALIEAWSSTLGAADVLSALLGVGVPASEVVRSRDIVHNPQLRHRRLFEAEGHPVTGRHELPTMPFRFSDVDRWMSAPAPTLGQDNGSILGAPASSHDVL
ncbi:MAG TPA: CoA transferase [Acidimicrobiales bacterium]|jgi:crotonobetainyl-CoA:carnitine CoA-transferase CaiB-like acyl-CoA transferase|nr:CoA transferase [Acidimicrobiales bacterium]